MHLDSALFWRTAAAVPCRFPVNLTCGGDELRSAAGWEVLEEELEAWELTDNLGFCWAAICQTQITTHNVWIGEMWSSLQQPQPSKTNQHQNERANIGRRTTPREYGFCVSEDGSPTKPSQPRLSIATPARRRLHQLPDEALSLELFHPSLWMWKPVAEDVCWRKSFEANSYKWIHKTTGCHTFWGARPLLLNRKTQ